MAFESQKKKRKLGVTSVKGRLHPAPWRGGPHVPCPGPALRFAPSSLIAIRTRLPRLSPDAWTVRCLVKSLGVTQAFAETCRKTKESISKKERKERVNLKVEKADLKALELWFDNMLLT